MTSPDLVLYNAFEKKDIGPKSYYDAVPKERKKIGNVSAVQSCSCINMHE